MVQNKSFFGTASLLKRILALIFDILFINLIIGTPFNSLIKKIIGENINYSTIITILNNNPEVLRKLSIILFFISILALFYFAVMEYKFGQTIGQMLIGIYVQSEDKEIKFWQVIVSNLFILPFFPFFILWVIDPMYMFFSNNQRLSEKIARIKIVQKYVVI